MDFSSFSLSYLFIFSILIISSECTPIDNGVESEPTIDCGAGYISVTFSVRNNFDGHVYAKGHYNETQCRTDQTGRKTTNIRLSFNSCGVQRTRSLNPRGVYVTAVLIITFHPKFITKVDRAYACQCFYMEAQKAVGSQLEVAELTTYKVTQAAPMPVCRYDVLEGQSDGAPVRYAIVGQQVYHKWTCETQAVDTYCMLVNSCYVGDGFGEQEQILDDRGCAIDHHILQNLEYINDLMAGQESHVFKFADRATLYFQCQIAITIRDQATPCPRPSCGNPSAAVEQRTPGYQPAVPVEQHTPGYQPSAAVEQRQTPGYQAAAAVEQRQTPGYQAAAAVEQHTPGYQPAVPVEQHPSSSYQLINSNASHSFIVNSNGTLTETGAPLFLNLNQSQTRLKRFQLLETDRESSVWDVRASPITAFDIDFDQTAGGKFQTSSNNLAGNSNNTTTGDGAYCTRTHLVVFFCLFAIAAFVSLAVTLCLFRVSYRPRYAFA